MAGVAGAAQVEEGGELVIGFQISVAVWQCELANRNDRYFISCTFFTLAASGAPDTVIVPVL